MKLYVHDDLYGGGIAQKLMDLGHEWIQLNSDLNKGDVYLGVYSDNIRAQKFYGKFGYQKGKSSALSSLRLARLRCLLSISCVHFYILTNFLTLLNILPPSAQLVSTFIPWEAQTIENLY